MRELKNYKIYSNGEEFLLENVSLFHQNSSTKIETAFFELNAKQFHFLDHTHYAIKVFQGKQNLVLLSCAPYNALLFGDKSLVGVMAELVKEQNFQIDNILGENELVLAFLKAYQTLISGTIEIVHSMSIMVLKKYQPTNIENVNQCSSQDIEDLAFFYQSFENEIFKQSKDIEEIKGLLQGRATNFYAYKENGKITSIAAKTRETEEICAISHVYTNPEYRGKGYARKVVSKLVEDILSLNKIPYLYVDNHNPISNHIYKEIGFDYLICQSQYRFIKKEEE